MDKDFDTLIDIDVKYNIEYDIEYACHQSGCFKRIINIDIDQDLIKNVIYTFNDMGEKYFIHVAEIKSNSIDVVELNKNQKVVKKNKYKVVNLDGKIFFVIKSKDIGKLIVYINKVKI